MISIAVVDDHRVVSRSLRVYLESFPDLVVVGVAASGEELLAHLQEWNPQIILMDLLLPGGMDGVEATRKALILAPGAKVIALTASVDEARLAGVMGAGATGYVRKGSDPEVLLAAVRAVASGRKYLDPSVGSYAVNGGEDLTRREGDVLRLLACGHCNREIAAALTIGEETVKTHVRSLLAKLRADNRAQAIAVAIKRGLMSPSELD